MQLNKEDIIKDSNNFYAVFCVLGSTIYARKVFDVNITPSYELKEVLKFYRKMEVMEK